MTTYDSEVLKQLNDITEGVTFGTPVIIKPAPGAMPGQLDPGELENAIVNAKNYVPAKSIEDIRRTTGYPNRNLNTVEIVTDTADIESDGHIFRVWVYYPRKPFEHEPYPAVIYLHAGSFFAGRAFMCENVCRYIAEKGQCVVFNVDYSTAPEHPYPTAKNELKATVDHVYENSSKYGVDKDKITIAAESASCSLSAAAAAADKRIKKQFMLCPMVSMDFEHAPYEWNIKDFEIDEGQAALIIPRLRLGRSDGEGDTAFMMQIAAMYLQHGESREDEEISPANGDVSKQCPTLIFTSEHDGLRPQGEYYAKMLRDAGVECKLIRYRGVHHAFMDKFGVFPQAQDAADEIAEELKKW